MIEYLIVGALPTPTNPYHDAGRRDVVVTQTRDTEAFYIVMADSDPTLPGDSLIGGFDAQENPVTPVDTALFNQWNPLGNTAAQLITDETGEVVDVIPPGLGTKHLPYHSVAGRRANGLQGLRVLGAPAAESTVRYYPAENQPFPGHMLRMHWPEITHPNKWGWQFELDKSYDTADPSDPAYRDPAGLFISVFADADCTQYLYVVQPFKRGLSHFQVDSSGDPVEVWLQNNYATQNTLEPSDIHFAICNGHYTVHEGRSTLSVDELEKDDALYWRVDQPDKLNNGNQVARSLFDGTDIAPTANDPISGPHKVIIKQAALALGIPIKEWNACKPITNQTTYKQAYLKIMACIRAGTITWPI